MTQKVKANLPPVFETGSDIIEKDLQESNPLLFFRKSREQRGLWNTVYELGLYARLATSLSLSLSMCDKCLTEVSLEFGFN